MGIFTIFKRKKKSEDNKPIIELENNGSVQEEKNGITSEKACATVDSLDAFLLQDKFISVKDKKAFLSSLSDYDMLMGLDKANMIGSYCNQNHMNEKEIMIYVQKLKDIDQEIKSHNEAYILTHLQKDEGYLDHVLEKSDPAIKLDKEQRIAVLSDEDYTLIIAGAGAGKTTTVAAKVKYLVDNKGIKPEEILVISFTNKAVNELKKIINHNLGISCPITTFHSTGNAIIHKDEPERLNIATEGLLYNVINQYLKSEALNNFDILNKIILFFSYYIDLDLDTSSPDALKKDLARRNLDTLKSNVMPKISNTLNEMARQKVTINAERVRSIEEAKIANFLFLNSIDYEYEKPYEHHIPYSKKMYCPDFTLNQDGKTIYLEHFGISEDGKNSVYTASELERYKKNIQDKIRFHQKHGTKLIYTYSKFNDGVDLLKHLEAALIDSGFSLVKRSAEEIYRKIREYEENRYFAKLTKLMMTFISNFKTNGYNENDFSRMRNQSTSERNKIFLDIAESIYHYYQEHLKTNNMVDFEDMINNSAKILREKKELKEKLFFKYIIVDEYQDISLQRFNLTKALSEVTDAKIIAVGDDWQSIYAFSGSKLKLFTDFEQSLGYADVLKIIHTYRNSQELIDIAGKFIQENPFQIRKSLISPKRLAYPVAIFTYSDDQQKNKSRGISGILDEKAKVLDKILATIMKRQPKENSSILLIGRYNFDAERIGKTSTYDYNHRTKKLKSLLYPKLNITFLTAHSSKGLGFDDVVILNAENGTYGFPSQIKDDPVLNLVTSQDASYEYAEERRLFYVALTRTRNRTYIIAPKHNPSQFVIELLNGGYSNVYLDDEQINKTLLNNKTLGNYCPVCGYPMYFIKSKYYGEKIWACSNDQEICDFATNDMRGGKTRIRKCPDCKNGYLLIKKKRGEDWFFLGCSNYKADRSGCEHAEPLDYNPCDESIE